ncbi:hypothetical protein RJ641_032680 [Dillenia turbinata]|uniref:Uncharacterized protein n=1 Tax=Dillenia turbinata TaxID=194707 RepID=A0AAN8VK52_9MAGN
MEALMEARRCYDIYYFNFERDRQTVRHGLAFITNGVVGGCTYRGSSSWWRITETQWVRVLYCLRPAKDGDLTLIAAIDLATYGSS